MKSGLRLFIVTIGISVIGLTGNAVNAQNILNLQSLKVTAANGPTRGASACVPHYTNTKSVNSYFTDGYFENNANINIGSGQNDTSYNNLYGMGTDLPAYKGGTININFTVDPNSTENVAVWLDLNNDFTFQSNEKEGELDNVAAGGVGSFSISVPSNISTGPHLLRLRLAHGNFSSNMDPCATYTDGECIDIGINVCGDLSPYCEPLGESLQRSLQFGHLGIAQIAVGDSVFKIDSLSACFDYLSQSPVVLTPGGFYSIHATFDNGDPTVGSNDTLVAIAWIDYDNDSVFSTAEQVGDTVRFKKPNETDVISFTLPNNILGYHRLRVALAVSSTGGPFSTYSNPCPPLQLVSGRDILLNITNNAAVDNISAIQQSMQLTNNPGGNGYSQLLFNTAHDSKGCIVISDVTGRILQSTPFTSTGGQVKQTLQAQGISAGIYFVTVEQNGKVAGCKKWMVQ